MEFKVLGPIMVTDADESVDIGGPRQRRLLAALVARANTPVSTERLIDIVFDGDPPQGATTTIRSYVARLRKSLNGYSDTKIVTASGGYVLELADDIVDADRFEAQASLGRRQFDDHDAIEAAETLREALALWRGPAYGEFSFEEWARGEAARLDELRIDAEEHLIEAQLACGLADVVIPDLRRLIEAHPTRERLRAQLMLALHRSGRHADALRAFETYRCELIHIGLEPSPELITLERNIAVHDPALQLTTPAGRALRGYRLGPSLGQGRYGEVFDAVQPGLGREVAIKVIGPELADNPGFIRQFDTEAQIVSRLEHAHLVPVYDYWREPNAAYIAMRLLPSSLQQHLECGPMEIEQVAALARHVGSALAAAHRGGVVHGNIHPSNVLLDNDGNYYLADLGLAGLEPASSTRTKDDATGFEAPEVRAGKPPGRATDQYGLAALVAYALTGVLPFGQRGALTAADRFPSVHAQRSLVPTSVDAVLWRAASWKPADRYHDVIAFIDDLVGALTGQSRPTEVAPINPFKGLEPFLESDAEWFFGRDGAVETVLARLASGMRLVAVIGASGSGKSSIVRAGVVPKLRAGALEGSQDWFVATMVPGERPLADLRTALRSIAAESAPEPDRGASVRSLLAAAVPAGQPVLLVIDQLEELYTLTPATERATFIDGLVDALSDEDSQLRVVATLRADFHDRPLHHSRFGRLVADAAVTVVCMDVAELDQAIREPAARAGLEVEPAVVTEIIADLVDQPAALPLLQFTLTELFERRSGRIITLDSYRAIGGVEAAVASRADDVWQGLNEDDHDTIRRLFLRLITVDDSGTATRRRVLRSELIALAGNDERLDRILRRFGDARLLTFDRDPSTRSPTVEVAHESLITQWPRLKSWVDDAGEGLRIRGRLTAATAQWISGNHDPGDLYRGGRLEAAEARMREHSDALTADEAGFLQASAKARDQVLAADLAHLEHEQRSNRRLRVLVAIVAVALGMAMVAGVLAVLQRNDARSQAQRADVQAQRAATREILASSTATLQTDPELSALLAIEAVKTSDSVVVDEAEQALHVALGQHRLIASVSSNFGKPSFSPDGTRFVASDAEGNNGQVWTIDPLAKILTLSGHAEALTSHRYSPDGSLIATTSVDGVRVWDAETGDQLDELPGIPALDVAFSNDGSKLAVSGFAGEFIWDPGTDDVVQLAGGSGENGFSVGVAFSPDDTLLAVAMNDSSGPQSVLFGVESGRVVHSLAGHTNTVIDVEFSLDGSLLYSASEDGTVRVWNVADGSSAGVFTGQGAEVRGLDLSGDGNRMVSAGGDGTVVIWDPNSFEEYDRLLGHVETVDGVEFSPDASLVITNSAEDQTTRVWNVASSSALDLPPAPGTTASATPSAAAGAVTFDSTGEWLIAAGPGRLTRWALTEGHDAESWDAPETIWSVAVSGDGALLATAGADGVRIVDSATGAVLAEPIRGAPATSVNFDPLGDRLVATGQGTTLFEGDGQVVVVPWDFWTYDAVFSPDGSRIAVSHTVEPATETTAPFDGVVDLIDADTLDVVASIDFGVVSGIAAQRDAVTDLAFAADGTLLATGSKDGTTALWNGTTLEPAGQLIGQGGEITAVAFAPTIDEIATSSTNGTIRIWSIESGVTRITVPSDAAVTDISYSPDGRYLAAADPSGAVRLYLLDLDELVATAESRTTRNLTDIECERYLHLGTCPSP